MRNSMRLATAVAALAAAAFVTPQAALACSGPMPTREEAVAAATIILAGRVVSQPSEWTYELDVERVFRGPQAESIVIGDPAPSTAPICSHQLKIGDRVVVALQDPTDIGLFSSAVWYLLPDGTVGTLAPEPPAATHDELFGYLRLLPDTSMPAEQGSGSLLGTLGAISLSASVALAVIRGGSVRRRSRRGPVASGHRAATDAAPSASR
ncbi:MAG TPA: hypothetical protein VFV59_07245 [Candidatus Limnocylindria bacterium]|nr:hypothetical protein [Candidatus Limnocylindria bacterium]